MQSFYTSTIYSVAATLKCVGLFLCASMCYAMVGFLILTSAPVDSFRGVSNRAHGVVIISVRVSTSSCATRITTNLTFYGKGYNMMRSTLDMRTARLTKIEVE